jgi:hypothetical protein
MRVLAECNWTVMVILRGNSLTIFGEGDSWRSYGDGTGIQMLVESPNAFLGRLRRPSALGSNWGHSS